MRTSIDPTTLRELLRYDAGDGVLYWRERDSKFFQPTEKREASGHAKWWNGRFAGKRACKSDFNRGYLRVCLFGDEYPAHRVIWAMETGQWPTNVIDHIDGDPANNRIANLRSATTAENNRNKANHGRSRFRGVSWRARQSIWVSAIKTNKKVTFLGCYKNEEDAARAYDVAAIEQHGNFARTNFPRADYEARIRSALVEAPAVKGEPIGLCYRYEPDLPWHVVESENQLPEPRKHFPLLEVRTVYTAPPADAGMREALANLLAYTERNECPHESTSRGGAIWTICDDCGRKWADDQGGFKPYVEPAEITAARAALTAPGATTKSDGGEPSSRTAGGFPVAAAPYHAEETGVIQPTRERAGIERGMDQGVTGGESAITNSSPSEPKNYFFENEEDAAEAADNGRNTGGKSYYRPSEPSSTRSEVTCPHGMPSSRRCSDCNGY